MTISVSTVTEPERLREEWQGLAQNCADQDAYHQPFFLLKWGELTADMWAPEYVIARRGDALIGLLPLYR
ncbi:MAG: hypothetical protein AAFW87_11815, partial [Pseudomonadota bacterium]